MSFSSEVKAELCAARTDRKCCAVAESYGVLLYCNCFSPKEIRIITASEDFASRLPKLFRKAFGLSFDILPSSESAGKKSFVINDREKIAAVYEAFGVNAGETLTHHVNLAVLEENCCRVSFVRGAFLAGGSVTDPEKRFHFELSTSHRSVARETAALLLELGFESRESARNGSSLLYFKQADVISDLLTTLGAQVSSMSVLTAKVDKEMRNTITRQINCDSANADKTVAAAQEQIAAIRRIAKEYGLDSLPEPLKDAALLRVTNPEVSLSDLAKLSFPPVSKSCLSHRLKKLMTYQPEVK